MLPYIEAIELTTTHQDFFGDTRATATLVQPEKTIIGKIDRAGDIDFVKFCPTESGIYTIETEGAVQTAIYAGASPMKPMFDTKEMKNASIYDLKAGTTYSLRISGAVNTEYTAIIRPVGNSALSLSMDNATLSTPDTIEKSADTQYHIYYYKTDVASSVEFTLENTDTDIFSLRLYTRNGQLAEHILTKKEDQVELTANLSPGEYFLKVTTYIKSTTNLPQRPYMLTVKDSPQVLYLDIDNKATPVQIPVGGGTYVFKPPMDSYYTISASGSAKSGTLTDMVQDGMVVSMDNTDQTSLSLRDVELSANRKYYLTINEAGASNISIKKSHLPTDVELIVKNVQVVQGQKRVSIPVYLDNANGKSIGRLCIKLSYNTDYISPNSTVAVPSGGIPFFISNHEIVIEQPKDKYDNYTSYFENGKVCDFIVNVLPDAPQGAIPISFSIASASDNHEFMYAKTKDGKMTVSNAGMFSFAQTAVFDDEPMEDNVWYTVGDDGRCVQKEVPTMEEIMAMFYGGSADTFEENAAMATGVQEASSEIQSEEEPNSDEQESEAEDEAAEEDISETATENQDIDEQEDLPMEDTDAMEFLNISNVSLNTMSTEPPPLPSHAAKYWHNLTDEQLDNSRERYDLDADGRVNSYDYSILHYNWVATPGLVSYENSVILNVPGEHYPGKRHRNNMRKYWDPTGTFETPEGAYRWDIWDYPATEGPLFQVISPSETRVVKCEAGPFLGGSERKRILKIATELWAEGLFRDYYDFTITNTSSVALTYIMQTNIFTEKQSDRILPGETKIIQNLRGLYFMELRRSDDRVFRGDEFEVTLRSKKSAGIRSVTSVKYTANDNGAVVEGPKVGMSNKLTFTINRTVNTPATVYVMPKFGWSSTGLHDKGIGTKVVFAKNEISKEVTIDGIFLTGGNSDTLYTEFFVYDDGVRNMELWHGISPADGLEIKKQPTFIENITGVSYNNGSGPMLGTGNILRFTVRRSVSTKQSVYIVPEVSWNGTTYYPRPENGVTVDLGSNTTVRIPNISLTSSGGALYTKFRVYDSKEHFENGGSYLWKTPDEEVIAPIQRSNLSLSSLSFDKSPKVNPTGPGGSETQNFILVNSPEYITCYDIVDDETPNYNENDRRRLKLFEQQNVTGKNAYYQTHISWWTIQGYDDKRSYPDRAFYVDVDFYNPGDTPVTLNVSNLAYNTEGSQMADYFSDKATNRFSVTIGPKEHRKLFDEVQGKLGKSPLRRTRQDLGHVYIAFDFEVTGGSVTVSSLAAYDRDNLVIPYGEDRKILVNETAHDIDSGEVITNNLSPERNGGRPNESDIVSKTKGIARGESNWIDANLEYVIDDSTTGLHVQMEDPFYPDGVLKTQILWMTHYNPFRSENSARETVMHTMPGNMNSFNYHYKDAGKYWRFDNEHYTALPFHINENANPINHTIPQEHLNKAKNDVQIHGYQKEYARETDDKDEATSKKSSEKVFPLGGWGSVYHYTVKIKNLGEKHRTVTFQMDENPYMYVGYRQGKGNSFTTRYVTARGAYDVQNVHTFNVPPGETEFEVILMSVHGNGRLGNKLLLN